jgi:hypothetical protein
MKPDVISLEVEFEVKPTWWEEDCELGTYSTLLAKVVLEEIVVLGLASQAEEELEFGVTRILWVAQRPWFEEFTGLRFLQYTLATVDALDEEPSPI